MSTCGDKLSIFDNPKYKDLLSDEEFINYLLNKLQALGYTGSIPVKLNEGDKIQITDQSIKDEIYEFTISYLDAKPPVASISVSPSSVEAGIIKAIGSLSTSHSFSRRTYKLESVVFDGTTSPNLNEGDLAQYTESGQGGNGSGANTREIGRTESYVARITIKDINGTTVTNTATLSRPSRWYWGITTDPNLANINVSTAVATGLGNPPNQISPNVGNGNYVWVAYVTSKVIRDTTLNTDQIEDREERVIQPVSGYNKNYFFQRTNLKSGGTINLLIE